MDFAHDDRTRELVDRLETFMADRIVPAEPTFHEQLGALDDRWAWTEAPVLRELQAEARELGLWNLFLPRDHADSPGLTNLQYAPLAEITGRCGHLAPAALNCAAPDTGNMEVLSLFGTPEQRERWLPAMSRMDSIGAFGLTEPHGGSDVAGGMETTATRDGDEWVLDGEKRWIGNATFADVIIVWARDTDPDAGGAVRGFVVPSPSDGMTITKIEGKQSLRIVQNADILLDRVRVPESHRLSGGSGTFRDAGLVLQRTRANAAWGAVGVQMAAYELALSYAAQREQFGRPIGGFQLMQDLLVRMLGNVSASLGMAVRNAQLLDEGRGSDAHSSLVKEFCATRMRETVALGRQLVGGNGVVLENRIAKYFADAEAMFSFEGTREMNTLIVGKVITGQSAFVR